VISEQKKQIEELNQELADKKLAISRLTQENQELRMSLLNLGVD